MKYTLSKIKRRLRSKLVSSTRKTKLYPFLYKGYWHYLLFPSKETKEVQSLYFSAQPNPGAGIGHQMANWISGYWWSKQFGLKFAHIPFSTAQWEYFLGFGENEKTVSELLRKKYKQRILPLFDENKIEEINRIKSIIRSYSGKRIVFRCEQDQFYKDQFGVLKDIQCKFYNAKARKNDELIYSASNYNIAIHVRRGDIVIGQKKQNPNLLMRWQNNDYFANVLANVLDVIETDKPIAIYLFSQGKESDFKDFSHFPNLHFCLDMNARDSFLHMVYANMLITSKSSFSYKPALLNRGIKVCPKDFWHGYPDTQDWIMCDEEGGIIFGH